MDDYVLNIDLETIFYNPEEEERYFKRLSKSISENRERIRNFYEDVSNRRKERTKKLEENAETMAQLITENKELEEGFDFTLLQQKIMNKKIAKSITVEDNLKEIIEENKARREEIALEMVDLQHELATKKEIMKKKWEAVKRAMLTYKSRLQIYIDVQHEEEQDTVTVFFFTDENPNNDNYYVVLLNCNNSWKVSNIQPPLEGKYLKELGLDLSRNDYERIAILKFLCGIRTIFMKHYLKNHS